MKTWIEFFQKEEKLVYFQKLKAFIENEYKTKVIYPPFDLIFKAFELTPFDKTKVIIIGQDPYYNEGQAMGLCFSVPSDVKIPKSLINIYKEMSLEYKEEVIQDGDLSYLANQGVLLLNASLTVEKGKPMSHKNKGYEILLSHILSALDEDNNPKVFMLWGNYAKNLKNQIKNPLHLVLESAHPSPLSAHQGFFHNNHFKMANKYLKEHGREEIYWIKNHYIEKENLL